MTWLGILTFVVCVASSEQVNDLQCLSCSSSVPHGCHRVAKCPKIDNQVCAAHVVNVTGKIIYRYHCQDYQRCPSAQAPVLMGKRSGHTVQQCHQCCRDHHKCNEKLCARTECATCQGVKDPKVCRSHTLCQIGEACFTEVKNIAGTYLYFMSCQRSTACPVNNANSLIGKRNVRRGHQSLAGHCMDCCYGKDCNKHLCRGFEHYFYTSTTQAATTTPHSTSTTSTTRATTVVTTTSTTGATTSTAATTMSTTRATTSTAATTMSTTRAATTTVTTELPCENIEQDGFKCSNYDALHFCTDTGSAFYMISHQLCRRHCGFCTPDTNSAHLTTQAKFPTTSYAPKTTTANPTTSIRRITTTTTTQRTTTATQPTTTTPTRPPTTEPPCVDNELDGFRCADYDSTNFCTDPSSFGHMIAYQACRKHCGICVPDKTTSPPKL